MKHILTRYAAVGFGLVAFVVAVVFGTVLTWGTGVPLLGGLANGILVSAILTIGLLAIDRFGTATIMWLALSLPAIFTTTLGPPGFYKIPIALVAGFLWDVIYRASIASGRRHWGLFIGGVLGALSIMALMLLALTFGFGKDAQIALDKYMSLIYPLIAINVFVTVIGIFVGRFVYMNRLSKLQLFINLHNISSQSSK